MASAGGFGLYESNERDQRHDEAAEHQHVDDRTEQAKQEIGEMPDSMEDAAEASYDEGSERAGDMPDQPEKRVSLIGPSAHFDYGLVLAHHDYALFLLEGSAVDRLSAHTLGFQ